ncbi:MAG: hypothetical protein MRJ65_15375 [Candidatus Brocadiaceae bacterium]|nr:hypothetical protein [Candidatus Brocadiaceae bacterium]
MESNGWIKMHRKTISSRVFRNEGLFKVWAWCLLKANHKPSWITLQTGRGESEVYVDAGQFIFGRHTAARELGMAESTVRNRMKKLKKLGNLDIQRDRHYSLITIVNWETYQMQEIKEDSKEDNQRTGKGQAKDTNKNDKNEKKNIYPPDSHECRLADLLLQRIIDRLPNYKRPDIQKWARSIDLMIRRDNRHPAEIEKVIDWCQSDDFWQSNILCTEKLRKKYDQLISKMNGKLRWKQESTISGMELI